MQVDSFWDEREWAEGQQLNIQGLNKIVCWPLPPSESQSQSQSRWRNSSSIPLLLSPPLLKCSPVEIALTTVILKFKTSQIVSKVIMNFFRTVSHITFFYSTCARFMSVSLKWPEVSESISCWRSLLYSRLNQKHIISITNERALKSTN